MTLTDLHRYCLQLDDEAADQTPVTKVTIASSARHFARRLLALPEGLSSGPAIGVRHGEEVEVRYLLHACKPWHGLSEYVMHHSYVLGAIEALSQADEALDWVAYWSTGDQTHLDILCPLRLVTPTRPFLTIEYSPEYPLFYAYSALTGERL